MPRRKLDAPAYRYHISGQARATLEDKDFLLGECDSPQSKAMHYAPFAEYSATLKKTPLAVKPNPADSPVTAGAWLHRASR